MTCSKYGCDEDVFPKPDGTGMECPVHGIVLPILHDNLIDRRLAQLALQEGSKK